ncbi:nucleotidyl transferase AbiEii/AbiGii toxin family protein [Asticcacaulis sp. ZE23SCel15]|uniref:nucleotidyl transferase AbiEii/AbiGii toxin family protein n=1 Tax=Asticcacaulis sp. ZE23SCel15 TaxID=3059027 RepID=UPI00265D913F|nr:nucleotidyl transferase AbiEii/AbiGii toxin family protein [Asticcacaulis sp. ZE23SCel15]WKL56685.1 nucleotidyl transferase AbiEii/AbiGii toxin family protein [Asticcacaulis sp. ZE23SCel15]
MIHTDEVHDKAEELDIHHVNVERDYIFGWLLKAIYENAYLGPLLVFKGGNCLRKAFYPDTRFSSDLDFSVSGPVDQSRLLQAINDACKEAQRLCGVEFLTQRNTLAAGSFGDKSRTVYKGHVFFNDFLGEEDDLTISIKVDVVEMDKLYLTPVSKTLIHPYSDSEQCSAELRCMALEEIIALKLKCLIQRRHSADLFDLVHTVFMDESIDVDRQLVLRVFLSKTIFANNPGAAKEILVGLPMNFFGGLWDKFRHVPKQIRFGFDQAVNGFKASIEQIFEGVPLQHLNDGLFFPSDQRNLIMTAGAEQRLLRLTYGGVERLIEPYSLAYKQAQGQPSKEYFYAYDLTGGQSSGPNIKSFLHSGVDHLELTDERFEPRFEIELSKAGEASGKSYFSRGFSSGRQRSYVGHARRQSANFKLQCPYCQKVFSRTTRDAKLREHKSPNGYRCAARHGYWIA